MLVVGDEDGAIAESLPHPESAKVVKIETAKTTERRLLMSHGDFSEFIMTSA